MTKIPYEIPTEIRDLTAKSVRAEFSLTALVYNLRRALNILDVARLMAAVGG